MPLLFRQVPAVWGLREHGGANGAIWKNVLRGDFIFGLVAFICYACCHRNANSRAAGSIYCACPPRPSLTFPLHFAQETSAPPGEIQLSQATADLLRASPPDVPQFELMERGPMKIKGKGEMVRGRFPKENGAVPKLTLRMYLTSVFRD